MDNRRNFDTRLRYGQGLQLVKHAGWRVDVRRADTIRGCVRIHEVLYGSITTIQSSLPTPEQLASLPKRRCERNLVGMSVRLLVDVLLAMVCRSRDVK